MTVGNLSPTGTPAFVPLFNPADVTIDRTPNTLRSHTQESLTKYLDTLRPVTWTRKTSHPEGSAQVFSKSHESSVQACVSGTHFPVAGSRPRSAAQRQTGEAVFQ